jgi:GNAT superfamily N-acetyltransferase
MWKLVGYHLAEHGIPLGDFVQAPPDFNLPYDETNPNYPEMDMERIDEAYLKARGNFWIAWLDDQPVGHIGAQDLGAYVELRRMYVRKEFRRQEIGSLLVQTLIEHCTFHKVGAIELWTAQDGPGRFLYEKFGFRLVDMPAGELGEKMAMKGEIRMRLELRN